MGKPSFKYQGSKVLLTEGINDCHVIASLCAKHKLPDDQFGLYECGSDDKAIKRLSALIAGSEPKDVIGIVIDADNPNLKAKWQKIKTKLERENYSLPNKPNENGTIVNADSNKPTVGIWLMPNNSTDGMLEDFCHQLIEPPALEVTQRIVEQAKQSGITRFKNAHHSKAMIHTYLAWQDEPGMPLGQAITKKALNADKKLAQRFIQFLSDLFLNN